MIFKHPTEEVNDDSELEVWSLGELEKNTQKYAYSYGVDYADPLVRWVVMESTDLHARFMRSQHDLVTSDTWHEMFERWRDARTLTLHATFIEQGLQVVSADQLFSHEMEESFVFALKGPQA